jgi:membrane-associated PAP2 superfamily phosphatase
VRVSLGQPPPDQEDDPPQVARSDLSLRDVRRKYLDIAVHLVLVPALLAAAALTLQYGPLDMTLASLSFDAATHSFTWRDSLWLNVLGHQAARALPVVVAAVAALAAAASFADRRLRPWRSILLTLVAAMLVGPLLINIAKATATPHCPAALQEFGGIVSYAADRAAPFWASSQLGAGHCSPSGHAGGGFALLSLYFAGWAARRPSWRWAGLCVGVSAGVLFGVVRSLQGAHFASAVLWSATVDWTVCALFFLPLLYWPHRATR